MLFTTVDFLFLFLPSTLLTYWGSKRLGYDRLPTYVLIIASLIFYGWFRWSYLAIIIFFIVFNYALPFVAQSVRERWRLWVIRGGIAVDLGILAFFKYSIFILENVTALTGINFAFQGVVLPIGISFFTFQCIMFVADHKHTRPDVSLRDFALYITFFPQLIAGPFVRPWVLLPQIKTGVTNGSASSSAWAAGILLIIGFFWSGVRC